MCNHPDYNNHDNNHYYSNLNNFIYEALTKDSDQRSVKQANKQTKIKNYCKLKWNETPPPLNYKNPK